MKKKTYTRPISVMLSDEAFHQIKAITDKRNIAISDYIREAIEKELASRSNIDQEK